VDLVREQLAATFRDDARRAGLVRDALVVWDDDSPDSSAVYRLRTGSRHLAPLTAGSSGTHSWPTLDRQAVFFADRAISWDSWTNAWYPNDECPVDSRFADFPHVLPDRPKVARPQPA
jgi:hypothetical protein